MQVKGLTQKDKIQLENPRKLYSSFGLDSNDYVHLYIYDLEDNLLSNEVLPITEFNFETEGVMDVDVGTHVRQAGFDEGSYKVKYLFLRTVAGKEQTLLTDERGFVHVGKAQTRVVGGKTQYFVNNTSGDKTNLTELYPRELKYTIKEISANKKEVKVGTQTINNIQYKKNFQKINRPIVYNPKRSNGGGKIRFDLTDPQILVATLADNDRGFIDAHVGGDIIIKGMYRYTKAEQLQPRTPPAAMGAAQRAQVFETLSTGEPTDPRVDTENLEQPTADYERFRDEDVYGSVCFVGDTKVKLSNNRTIPIKMMKPGMKVKTEQGYARVLKVVKDNRGFGDKLVQFKKLITTDHHPIKYRGKWYMANEIGKEFISKPLDVWNLVLDKHHTIYANNIVSATLGKWSSTPSSHWSERFLESRNRRIDMLRGLDESDDGGDIENSYRANQYDSEDETIVDEPFTAVTREIIEQSLFEENLVDDTGTFNTNATPEVMTTYTQVPVDYKARIIEVLDRDRIKVSLSYEAGATQAGHSGEDNSRKIFDSWVVNFTKSDIYRLNTYLVTKSGYNLVTNIADAKSPTELGPLMDSGDKDSRYFRLYETLEDDIEENDLCYFVEEKMEPYEDVVTIVPFETDDEEFLFLRVPDLNSVNNPITFRGTPFKKHGDLVGTDSTVIQDIENKILSSSILDVKLNIDYSQRTNALQNDDEPQPGTSDYGFGNFVHFGSAVKRIENFKSKLELVEKYTSQSLALNNVTGSLGTRTEIDTKKNNVLNSFDPYEKYLYYESGSYVSSSVGEYYNATWPKDNSSTPYVNNHTSHSDSTTWFDTWRDYAKTYDIQNQNRLVNNIPQHVGNDRDNNVFLDFVDMTGQQFDEIWTYLKHFTDINDHSNKLSDGISKDIVREVAKGFGFQVDNGNDLVILPEYLLGKNPDGSDKYESPQEEVTEEIWKRILNNLPFFLRNKGNIRAVKGLLNCYGIPSSMLRVREYGGPDLNDRVSYEIKRKFTYALDFKSSEYVKTSWADDTTSGIKPETIEFRFRSPISKDQVIVQKDGDWAIQLRDNGETDAYGYLDFAISGSSSVGLVSSSLQPFYNDDMWSVMLTRVSQSGTDLTADTTSQKIKYELSAKQYDAGRNKILYQTSESLNVDGTVAAQTSWNDKFQSNGNLYIGGSGSKFVSTKFSGSLMEFRLWSEPLSQSAFENHVRAPKTYNGNTTSSYYDNMILRYPLDNNVTYATTSSIVNRAYPETYKHNGTTNLFTGNAYRSLTDIEEMKIPNIGPNRRNATKIRIEPTRLISSLTHNVRSEASAFDLAPVDSNKLGIYFSPVDILNEDIAYSVAGLNVDNEIGDPRDQYRLSYRGLDKLNRDYFKKYSRTNNFWDYLRIIDFYDGSIWKQLEKFIPARANATLGVLIEPHILERSKEIVGKAPEFDNNYFENAGEFVRGLSLSNFVSGSTDRSIVLEGEVPNYDGLINVHNMESSSLGTLGLPSLVRLNQIDARSDYGSLYATASVTFGGTTTEFTETLQPFISQSRLSEHNEIKNKIYTSSLDAYTDTPFSSSFEPAEFQSMAYESSLFRLFYKGQLLTKKNTIDGKEPVEVIVTTPTKLVTQEPGDSKLKVE